MATEKQQLAPQEWTLVILGPIGSQKRLVTDMLFGERDPQQGRIANCIKHDGQLSGRRLTVVVVPGWWRDYPLIDTAERTKHELLLSVQHCPPGPHAFILTIETDTFTKKNMNSVKEHLSLFGENIWRHTIVVFTRGESLRGKTIEQHIESEGEALKWLVEKCGNRYCVFDSGTRKEDQVVHLLGKVQSVVEGNSGSHFEVDDNILRKVEETKRAAQERGSAHQLKVEEKRNQLVKKGPIQSLPEVRIVMLGWVSCGKSSARNVILNKDECTPRNRTKEWERRTGLVDGRQVSVVDTPGWWKYFSARYTPEWVKMELEQSVTLGSKSPHALLLVIPADVSFLEEQRRITEDNMKMFGEMVWRHTMVLFTWGDTLGNMTIEEHIESEGEPLRWLVEKCGNRYHVFDNVNRGDGSQVRDLLKKIDELEASVGYGMTYEAPVAKITDSPKKEKVKPEMVELLDKEWNKRENKLEEMVTKMWHEIPGSHMTRNQSTDHFVNFHEGELPVDATVEKRMAVNLPETECSATKLKLTMPSEVQGRADHEPHEEDGDRKWFREMVQRECARYEVIMMRKVLGIISELHSQSKDMTSEPDVHEREQSTQKVCRWLTGSSGIGSELEDEDINSGQ